MELVLSGAAGFTINGSTIRQKKSRVRNLAVPVLAWCQREVTRLILLSAANHVAPDRRSVPRSFESRYGSQPQDPFPSNIVRGGKGSKAEPAYVLSLSGSVTQVTLQLCFRICKPAHRHSGEELWIALVIRIARKDAECVRESACSLKRD